MFHSNFENVDSKVVNVGKWSVRKIRFLHVLEPKCMKRL